MISPTDEEIWALCQVPRHQLFRLRYTLEAYEGLCLSTTPPGRQGLVWLRTSRGLRRSLEDVLESLAREMDLAILGWGTGLPASPPDGQPRGHLFREEILLDLARAHVLIEGRVQGVWFRASARDVARELQLAGWARNLADGSVEAVFEGPRGAVERAIAWCRHGPPGARVDRCDASWEPPTGAQPPFEIRAS